LAVPAIACIIALSASLLMLVVVVVLRPTWLVRHLLAPTQELQLDQRGR
jgi:hypothetical protein